MARKTRIENPGACYHIINRGNFREWIFQDKKDEGGVRDLSVAGGGAVEVDHACVGRDGKPLPPRRGDAVGKSLERDAVASNHVQHAFQCAQGRARARLPREVQGDPAGKGKALGKVCHYIDLNPVRAGIVPIGKLESYGFGSFRRLLKPKERCGWQRLTSGLEPAGWLTDTLKGRESYRRYLKWLMTEIAAGREQE